MSGRPPNSFLLDEQLRLRFVAGVPPDYFSVDGQLWGTPVYDCDALRRTHYQWCIARNRALLAHVDLIRLDHFRGFAAAWLVPAGAPTGARGPLVARTGGRVLERLARRLGRFAVYRRGPGAHHADVHALRDQFHLLGNARPAVRL